MAVSRMHADEVDTDVALVRRLVAGQFPRWGDRTVEPVRSAGTVHAIYRLGTGMVVRLPRVERATSSFSKELQWLPRLRPRLPLAVPVPLTSGVPAEGYPWR
ncbi:MAG TPA: phosphotransferase, partial [Chloroflexota bacterium]|nr:phosphotransferase [Chloroflexota bacterium]